MSLNKYMHPRNPFFNNQPNFEHLSRLYPSLKPFLNVKNQLNFKDPYAVRELCCVLLKSAFNLSLDIPVDRLIPRVPQRLNYILWVEDLLSCKSNASGIDIGCGSSCIFSLLACALNKNWKMLTSEIDDLNYKYAINNVTINNLTERIRIRKVLKDTYLLDLVNQDDSYDFMMCNPPFYKNNDELIGFTNTRKPNVRSQAKSLDTAEKCESIYDNGGEIEFVKGIIEDSVKLGTRVRIYTTMFGKKSSLIKVKEYLEKEKLIKNISETQFCQGNTMRWGLAWSFCDEKLLKFDYFKESQKPKPILIRIDKKTDQAYEIKNFYEQIKNLLQNELNFEIIDENSNNLNFTFKAYENTWSHQRQKRRQIKRETFEPSMKKLKTEQYQENENASSLVECNLQVKQNNELNFVQIDYIKGLNKDYCYQIGQFIKNNIK